MLLVCVSVLVLFSTYVRVDDIYFGIGSSPCMRCAVHFAEAGNGDTVNQRCTGLDKQGLKSMQFFLFV